MLHDHTAQGQKFGSSVRSKLNTPVLKELPLVFCCFVELLQVDVLDLHHRLVGKTLYVFQRNVLTNLKGP